MGFFIYSKLGYIILFINIFLIDMDWIKENFALINDHPLLLSALIVLSSIIVAKLADIILTRILSRAVRKTVSDLDDKILELFHKPIFYSLLFIGFSFAVKVAQLPSYIDYALVGVFKTITIFIWFIVLLNVFSLTVLWAAKQSSNPLLQHRTFPLFNNLGKIVIVTFGIYFILLSWNININGFLASAGVLGIVLGLAAQDTVSNLFAGIFLMADSPFKEGDYILLDTGERGYVKKMGIRSTRFMTRDDIEITIPNSVIASSKIVNESGGPEDIERVRINIVVAYGSDIDEVKDVLKEIALNNSNVLKEPEPRVRFRKFSSSGLKLQLLFWIFKPAIRGRTVDEINTDIYKTFSKRNIIIPYPTVNLITNKDS